MSYGRHATRYREMEVLSATPGQLVVIVYDHLLLCLRRARVALEAGDIELRSELIAKARAALGELLATLDRERGGQIASGLASLYAFLLAELIDIGLHPSTTRLDRVIGIVAELRDAFAQIAVGTTVDAPAFMPAAASA